MTRRPRYLSYLLRLWQTSDGEAQVWRASLESPGSGQRTGFANLQSLVAFLETEIGQSPTSDTASKDDRDSPRSGPARP